MPIQIISVAVGWKSLRCFLGAPRLLGLLRFRRSLTLCLGARCCQGWGLLGPRRRPRRCRNCRCCFAGEQPSCSETRFRSPQPAPLRPLRSFGRSWKAPLRPLVRLPAPTLQARRTNHFPFCPSPPRCDFACPLLC